MNLVHLQRIRMLMLVGLVVAAFGSVHSQPQSGDWQVNTDFGQFIITVSPGGTSITKIKYTFAGYNCGGVSFGGTITSSSTWNITGNQFTINSNLAPPPPPTITRTLTISGTFTSEGNEVSGTYSFNVSGTICSGSWGPVVVPVTLYSFSAVPLSTSGYVLVEWKTISEISNYGFLVQKDTVRVQQAFAVIPGSFTPGQGTTLVPHSYMFIDSSVTPGRWAYRLLQIDLDGTQTVFEPKIVDVTTMWARDDEAAPTVCTLQQNYPNPFNPSTTIKYELPKSSEARLSVYDLLGREVTVLVNERRDAGVHEVKFDGLDLASGVYFYRLTAGDFVQLKKLVILK